MNYAPYKFHYVSILSLKIEGSIRRTFVDSICQSRAFVLYPFLRVFYDGMGYTIYEVITCEKYRI